MAYHAFSFDAWSLACGAIFRTRWIDERSHQSMEAFSYAQQRSPVAGAGSHIWCVSRWLRQPSRRRQCRVGGGASCPSWAWANSYISILYGSLRVAPVALPPYSMAACSPGKMPGSPPSGYSCYSVEDINVGRIFRSPAASWRTWHAVLGEDELHSAESGGRWFVRESGRLALGYRSIRTWALGGSASPEDDGRRTAEGANIQAATPHYFVNALRTTRSTLPAVGKPLPKNF